MMQAVDCHCHIFNIVSVGLKAILHELNQLSNLVKEAKQAKSAGHTNDDDKSLVGKLRKLKELYEIFTGSSEDILKLLDKHYHGRYKMFPLLFDGDFLLDSSSDAEQAMIKDDLSNLRDYLQTEKQSSFSDLELKALMGILDEVERKISSTEDSTTKDGFTIQYEELLSLKANPDYRDKIYPFLGVDPRRDNIVSFLDKVGKNLPFAGIKLYAPNGFSPTDPRLDAVYEHCSKNQVPIIAHCSYGGFATPMMNIDVNGWVMSPGNDMPSLVNGKLSFTKSLLNGFETMVKERARALNHPRIWRKVLEKHPGLILVLAHFGSSSDDACLDEWRNEIRDMMQIFPNLHTDISCTSDLENLNRVKAIFDAPTYSSLRNRILYGSDYFLDMFFNSSFDEYLGRIKTVFQGKDFDQISQKNPERFMSLWYKDLV